MTKLLSLEPSKRNSASARCSTSWRVSSYKKCIGGPSLRQRNAKLVQESATLLAHHWKTERGSPDLLTGSMGAVRLPISEVATPESAQELRAQLFEIHRIEVAITAFAGSLWARISAQAYNEPADYQRLAEVFRS
jgi:isopenicillin-N epimerase